MHGVRVRVGARKRGRKAGVGQVAQVGSRDRERGGQLSMSVRRSVIAHVHGKSGHADGRVSKELRGHGSAVHARGQSAETDETAKAGLLRVHVIHTAADELDAHEREGRRRTGQTAERGVVFPEHGHESVAINPIRGRLPLRGGLPEARATTNETERWGNNALPASPGEREAGWGGAPRREDEERRLAHEGKHDEREDDEVAEQEDRRKKITPPFNVWGGHHGLRSGSGRLERARLHWVDAA
jgi:hypothetical protein